MIRILGLFVLAFAVTTASVVAQGTKDSPAGSQPTSGSRNGAATNSGSDSMGGAFKGTGTPNYGTSPGMGSQKKTRN